MKNILKFAVIYLIILVTIVFIMCAPDDCTKLVNRQKVTVGMTLKSSLSKGLGVPHDTRENPMIIDWWNLDSISSGIHSCGVYDSINNQWEAKIWASFEPRDVTITKRLFISSTNMIIQGNILGDGLIEMQGCNSKLVVLGTIDDRITYKLAEGCEVIIEKPLANNTNTSYKYTVEKPCDFKTPQTIREDGVLYYYTEYDGTGVKQGTSLYKGKL